LRIVSVFILILSSAGCATYTDRMQLASQAAFSGDYAAGVAAINGALGVSDDDELRSMGYRARSRLSNAVRCCKR
jgi:hypothetical protein